MLWMLCRNGQQNRKHFFCWCFMDVTQVFGAVLRAERRKRGLTQTDLALRAGLHLNFICMVERGESSPTLPTLYALADALELPAEALIATVSQQITTGRRAPKNK
ncbi:helix-turn-helix domain-containing protein [Aquabacterium sp. A7-Y]|uniref:helix-turn-helix domain-containing protein n=1 Tax=Aquabacterium sp. A7-Y TaxID=1349605 RepID=UPI00223D8B96|nr:helix-turn-helix transcriptional regulator [Aquabacterium sp. A7-Y]MCW7541022.1 helix-turn-helix domain-containing protein [Aquabacterium sp. A7-Y]